jgi:hypothetical protein
VAQPATADEEHRYDEEHERHETQIATPRKPALAFPKVRGEPSLSEVLPEQLESCVGGQPLGAEFDTQVTLDSRDETALSYPH